MSISKREKILILILLVIALFCLYYFFFFKPYMDDISEINNNITESEVQVLTNRQLMSTENTLAAEIEEKTAQLETLSANITQGFDQPPLLVYLDQTINRYGTKITYLFSQVKQMGELYACPVTVVMKADYDGIKKILTAFSEGEYFVKVTGLIVSAFDTDLAPQTAAPPEEEPEETSAEPSSENLLSVTLYLELYSLLGEIPPDTAYDFSDGYRFDTDVFQ